MFMFLKFAATADGVWTFVIIFKVDLGRPALGPMGAPCGACDGVRKAMKLFLNVFELALSQALGAFPGVIAELPEPGFGAALFVDLRTTLVGALRSTSFAGSSSYPMLAAKWRSLFVAYRCVVRVEASKSGG
jgi:hypothetical protein